MESPGIHPASRKNHIYFGVSMLLVLLFGGISGWYFRGLYWKMYLKKIVNTEVRANESHYRFINPLLECSISEEQFIPGEGKPSKVRLNQTIKRFREEEYAQSVSVYFRDLNNGPWLGINEKEWFAPASLLKVPLALMLYRAKENDPSFFSKELKLESSGFIVKGNFQESDQLKTGEMYPLSQLIEKMLTDSDNDAALTIMNQVMPMSRLNDLYKELGIEKSTNEYGDEGLTVKDYAAFFRVLFNASYLSKDSSEEMLKLLLKSTFTTGLTAKLPMDVEVSHKFGERQVGAMKQLHDCGIVYVPNRPYLLCIMTRGNDFNRLASVIADVSKQVYDDVVISSSTN